MEERRAHPRVKGPFDGWWDGAGRQTGRVVDLSIGGCFVESLSPPQVGQVVIVSVTLRSGQVQLPGEVMYAEPRLGFAVRFVDMPEGIAHLVRKEIEG